MKIPRTRLLNRTTGIRDATLCVIATEGEKTEKQYFQIFQKSRIQVVILPTEEDGKGEPRQVFNRLDVFRDQYDLGVGDELWLMVDKDRHRLWRLSDVCQEAVQKGIGLAISNPCFELWLYLHFSDAEMSDTACKMVEQRLKQHLGSYNKTNLDLDQYRPAISEAVRRAKALHLDINERWPSFPGTYVYKIVERLILPDGELP